MHDVKNFLKGGTLSYMNPDLKEKFKDKDGLNRKDMVSNELFAYIKTFLKTLNKLKNM
jgi:hypothetical protein